MSLKRWLTGRRPGAMAFKWPDSTNPTKAWEILRVRQRVEPAQPTTEPRRPDRLRLVCISDTHNLTDKLVRRLTRRALMKLVL
jgi:hypothetical protein